MTFSGTDRHGDPWDGSQLRYSITGANPGSGSVALSEGEAAVTWTGASAGVDQIEGYVDENGNSTRDEGEPQASAEVDWVVDPALAAAPATAERARGAEHTVTFTGTDEHGDDYDGVPLRFTITGANPGTGSATLTEGEAAVTWTGTSAGVDEIEAYADVNGNGTREAGEPQAGAEVNWVVDPTLAAAPAAAERPQGAEHTVTFSGTDRHGNPWAGAQLRYTITGANPGSGNVALSAGEAAVTWTGANTGVDEIEAYVDENGNSTRDEGEPVASAEVDWVVDPTLAAAPEMAERARGAEHTVTFSGTGRHGEDYDGVLLRYAITGANPGSGTVTLEDGNADVTWTGTNAGIDEIEAYADVNGNGTREPSEPQASAEVDWTVARNLAAAPATADRPRGADHTVTFTGTDEHGDDYDGVPLRFTITGANPGSGSVTLDEGDAAVTWTGENAGLDEIEGYVDENGNSTRDEGEPLASADVNWVIDSALSAAPASAERARGDEHTVTFAGTDEHGNPLDGEDLRYSIAGVNPGSGSVEFGEGDAAVTWTGENAGVDEIEGYVDENGNSTRDEGEPQASAEVDWVVEPGLQADPVNAERQQGEAHTVTFTGADAHGNPYDGVPLRYETEGANAGTGSVPMTGGTAAVTWTGTAAGDDVIGAYVDENENGEREDGEPVAIAAVEWTAPSGPPPPEQGKTANLDPIQGQIEIKCPGQAEFIGIQDAVQVPVGCLVDATNGVVKLTTATGGAGAAQAGEKTQSANFWAGIFRIKQKARNPVTELVLSDPLTCGRAGASVRAHASKRRRRLWGSGVGKFRTRGKGGSAAVRGTKWVTVDRCNGTTLFRVRKGTVRVRDFRRKKTFFLRKGQTYVTQTRADTQGSSITKR